MLHGSAPVAAKNSWRCSSLNSLWGMYILAWKDKVDTIMQAENNCEPTNIIQLLQFHTLPSNQRCSEFSTSRTLHNNVYLTSSHRPHKHTYLLKLILSYPSLYHSLSNLCQGWRKLLTVSLISHATVVHSVTDRTIFAFNTFANFFTWSSQSYPTALWCSPHPHESTTSGTALFVFRNIS